ncbi:MAG: zinc-dependent metalloprotease [Bacteriovoracaceae bacterium]|nr:zinc-dependent metalloprotease [Bacteriovoracaceae bacterium]
MKKIKSSVLAVAALSVLTSACVDVKSQKKKNNRVTNNAQTNQIIGDDKIELQVISESAFKMAAIDKSVLSISNSKVMSILKDLPQGTGAAETINKSKAELADQEESLYVGFPIGLVGEQNVFGGVITKVSDQVNESLGTLKLTDLTPIHVRTVINTMPDGTPVMTLMGCFSNCAESSAQSALLNFPVVGYNQETGMIILDMSAIGKELDLISMLDPQGQYTQLKAVSSNTTAVEYDMKTLIFDIKTKMIPVTASPSDASAPITEFSVRWYLKLNSDANPAFESRSATEGVGFFQTDRGANSKITRFSTTEIAPGMAPVKYYIKNVPEEFKNVFARALDSWNVEFRKTIGHNLLSYEFVDATDPRADLLVPGDIRFNIIEWDLINKAGYGGLGPSIANQHTGQTMSANVLVQGPTIVKLYKEWFGVSEKARELKEMGQVAQANKLIKEFNVKISKELDARTSTQYKLKLGKHLDMNIHAQKAELMDPIAKGSFEIIPAGMSYETYMDGYMLEIVAHEVGHNLGLRHNFKGNLGAYENGEEGSVSRSVMEYLGRPYRHLNTIGPYDRMAIAYGYTGAAPKHLDWFCTDEDQPSDLVSMKSKSPECSKSDATSDPFSFWEGRIDRVLDLVLERKSDAAPVWTVKEVTGQLSEAIQGLAAYALSAENTADSWTNFFGKNDRPEDKSEVKPYVLYRIKKKLCNPKLQDVIASKESDEARGLTEKNLNEVIQSASAVTTVYGLTTGPINCAE